MPKRWLLHLLSGLLVASLCSFIITTVMGQTVLNSRYLEGRFADINGYNRLSQDISTEVVKQSGLSAIPGANTALQGIISPTAMKQKVNGALDGLQAYYQGKGNVPTINLNDFATQAQAAGVPLGQDSDLFQPVTLGPKSSKGQHPALNLGGVRTITLLTSILLVVTLGLLSWQWRQYAVLPNVVIMVGVVIGLVALFTYIGPGRLSHYISLSSGSYAFAALGRDLVQNIADDLAHRFGVIAAICLGAGIITRIVAKHLQAKGSERTVLTKARASATIRN